MAKKEKKLAAKKPEVASKVLVADPDKADRTLLLGGKELRLEAGLAEQELELTPSQLGELKEKYPYLQLK